MHGVTGLLTHMLMYCYTRFVFFDVFGQCDFIGVFIIFSRGEYDNINGVILEREIMLFFLLENCVF